MRLTTKFVLSDSERLYATRRLRKENQWDVARRYGFHQTAISKMEKGEIPVNPKLLPDLVLSENVPEYLYVSILRRRYQFKLCEAAKATGIATHRIGDMERGREYVAQEYVNWLHSQRSN